MYKDTCSDNIIATAEEKTIIDTECKSQTDYQLDFMTSLPGQVSGYVM